MATPLPLLVLTEVTEPVLVLVTVVLEPVEVMTVVVGLTVVEAEALLLLSDIEDEEDEEDELLGAGAVMLNWFDWARMPVVMPELDSRLTWKARLEGGGWLSVIGPWG